jgi:alpha-1,2-mannosyltransferase
MRRSFAALLAAEAGLGAALASWVMTRLSVPLGSDFAVYYAAARALRLDPAADVYRWSVIVHSMSPAGPCRLIPSPFVYPPLLAILLEPLTLVPCATAFYAWGAVNAILVAGTLYLIARIWPMSAGMYALLCAATLLAFPVVQGMWYGQVHLLVLFGLVLALWRLQEGDQVGAGVVLALIALVQVIPGLFAVYFVVRREWRVVVGIAAGGLAAVALTFFVVGPQGMLTYAHSLGGTYAINHIDMNVSLVYRLGLWFAALVAAIYLAILLCWRGDRTTGYLWTVATMILVSPIAWAYFMAWLLPVFLGWWQRGTRRWRTLSASAYLALYFSRSFILTQVTVMVIAWLVLGWDYMWSADRASARRAASWFTAPGFLTSRTGARPAR